MNSQLFSRLSAALASPAIWLACAGLSLPVQAAIVISGPGVATANINSGIGCPSGATSSNSVTTSTAYNISIGATSTGCNNNVTNGTQFASASGDASAGTFSALVTASRPNILQPSSASVSTIYSVTNNGPTAQNVSVSNLIVAGGVGFHWFGPSFPSYNFSLAGTSDFSARVSYSTSLDGVVLNNSNALARRFVTFTGNGNLTVLPGAQRDGVFGANSTIGQFQNSFGNFWYGVQWNDFIVNTDLGTFAAGETRSLSFQISALAEVANNGDNFVFTRDPGSSADAFASIGDPFNLRTASLPSFTATNVDGTTTGTNPSTNVPLPSSILLLIGGLGFLLWQRRHQ